MRGNITERFYILAEKLQKYPQFKNIWAKSSFTFADVKKIMPKYPTALAVEMLKNLHIIHHEQIKWVKLLDAESWLYAA